jgi:hypothetical protein
MLLLVATAVTIWAEAPKANIVGSPHDFTSSTYTFTGTAAGATAAPAATNLCFFCHIVHKTATNSSGTATTASLAPGRWLWNHTLSSTASYGVYSSATFNAVLTAAGVALPTDLGTQNNMNNFSAANLCLSCHDGTVAISSFYEGGFSLPANGSSWNNGHGSSTTMYTGMELTDLTKTHPVNFQYSPAVASIASLTSPASPNSVDAAGDVPLYGNNYIMQCTTCHDPHNGVTAVHGSLFPYSRATFQNYTGSGGFCIYCHQ